MISSCKRARSFGAAAVALATGAEASAGPLNMVPNAPNIMAAAMVLQPCPPKKRLWASEGGKETKLCRLPMVAMVVVAVSSIYTLRHEA